MKSDVCNPSNDASAGAPASEGDRKLTRDLAYSMASFAALAISGMAINVAITAFRDAAALGIFNQSYAAYIMASQLAAWGLHYSVLRHSALHDRDAIERGRCFATAIICALVGGITVCVLLFACGALLGQAFDSQATGAAIRNAALGLAIFPINKVLLAHLNALRHMRAYALLQAGRYVSIMVMVTLFAASPLPIESATIAFLVAEALILGAATVYLNSQREWRHAAFSRSWVQRHLQFGSKGLLAGMFAEFNSRVDVLLIGLFMSDRLVGIYSFAAMLADGLYHVLGVVRLNFNPVLVRAMRDNDWQRPVQLLRNSRKFVMPAATSLSLLLVVGFCVLSEYLMPDKGLMAALPSLVVLLATLSLISSLVPFDNLLLVSGHPGYQTLQQVGMVTANVLFGVLLLGPFGIIGVAMGTAISYFVSVALLVLLAQRRLQWNLLTNTHR